MSNSHQIMAIRGTMFYPRIPFDWSEASKLIEQLKGFVPVVYGTPQMDNNVIYGPGDWELRSPDGTVRLVFQAQKIDYIEFPQREYSNEVIADFTNKCSSIFCDIVARHGQPSTRLAIAPSFFSLKPFQESKTFLCNIFKDEKASFSGASIDNCDFSQVFRPTRKIAENEIAINFLSKFSTETTVSVIEGLTKQTQRIRVDFDINTIPKPGLVFPSSSIEEFFSKAVSFCDEFYLYYFES